MAAQAPGTADLMRTRFDALAAHLGADLAPPRFLADGAAPGCRPQAAEGAAVAIGAGAAAAAALLEDRGGPAQEVEVSTRHAAAATRSSTLITLDGAPPPTEARIEGNPLMGFYETRDGRSFYIHGFLPHLARGTLEVLGLETPSAPAIADKVAGWEAEALETALAEARMCGAYARPPAEWDAHPQARRNAQAGPLEILRIGDAPPEPLPGGPRPLSGVRVLDMTRILAGPTCARTLAEHGAEALLVGGRRLDNLLPLVLDTGHGKRSCWLDIDAAEDLATLRGLAAGADVFSQGFRSGSLDRRGLSPEEMATLRPGLVYVSVNCYGHDGPWTERPGWDQLASAVSGLAHLQGGEGPPALMPATACDYVTGYLAAFGAMTALRRRAREGGSWHVRVSLAQTAVWLRDFGPLRPAEAAPDLSAPEEVMTESLSPLGRLRHVAPAARMSATPPRWERPAAPLGAHAPAWEGAR